IGIVAYAEAAVDHFPQPCGGPAVAVETPYPRARGVDGHQLGALFRTEAAGAARGPAAAERTDVVLRQCAMPAGCGGAADSVFAGYAGLRFTREQFARGRQTPAFHFVAR